MVKLNYIVFEAGNHLILPFEGYKFLRFSSKISGSKATESGIQSYTYIVTRMAEIHFGSRVQSLDEAMEQRGKHSWNEVHELIRSYEQVRFHIFTINSRKFSYSQMSLGSVSAAHLLNVVDPLKNLDIPQNGHVTFHLHITKFDLQRRLVNKHLDKIDPIKN